MNRTVRPTLYASLLTIVLGCSMTSTPSLSTSGAFHVGGSAAHELSQAHTRHNEVGGDWSGYAALHGDFRQVQASWVEPSAVCHSDEDLASPWVGIDGYGSNTVEQIGTDIGCRNGVPYHAAWYEMFPADSVYFDDPVSAGDHMTASVRRVGSRYTMTLANETQHWSRTFTAVQRSKNVSAEVVLEAPGSHFPDFGRIQFTNATINGRKLLASSPVAMDAGHPDGTVQTHAAPIQNRDDFNIAFLHE